jgi:AcrR family transcriptional regulator
VRRTKSQSEETRQRILDAAEAVFIEIGVSKASLERIAAEAGVTRGAIYWHFANKQELLTAIFARVYDLHVAVLARSFEDAADPLQVVLDWALNVIELFGTDEHTRMVYKIIVTRCEYLSEMQEAFTLQRSMHDTMVENFRRAFERAEQGGLLAEGCIASCRACSTIGFATISTPTSPRIYGQHCSACWPASAAKSPFRSRPSAMPGRNWPDDQPRASLPTAHHSTMLAAMRPA